MEHRSTGELLAGLNAIYQSPGDEGVLELIVRRPEVGQREVLADGRLDRTEGLVGDTWKKRASSRTPDGSPHPDMQLNIMNSRAIDLMARGKGRWSLSGDQLFLDLDLSEANVPPGTRLAIGGAVVEVTNQPHTGCGKFAERFGLEALKFVNSPLGKKLRLRGLNAKVVLPGGIRIGDVVRKLREG